MQRDPRIYIRGMSLYQYLRSRPTILLDPSGLVDLSLDGGEYDGLGGSLALEIHSHTQPCSEDPSKCETEFEVELKVSIGIGIGGHINVLGRKVELEWTGPQVEGRGSGKCHSPCGGTKPDCCKVCADIAIQVGYKGSVGVGIASIEQADDIRGSIRVCYLFGSSCPQSGLAWGFCGHISVEATVSTWWFERTYDLIDPIEGCHAFKGTKDMLNY